MFENIENGIITQNIDSEAYSIEYIKELKYKDIVVDSLEEALKLAEDYKESGKYNWFRGQTGLWPLISTGNRLNDFERNEAEKKLKRFDNWANANGLFSDYDSSEAIAQHYGLKTMFIDFTTDPKIAAYFASDGINYEKYQYSCIYCLNTIHFENSLNSIKKYFPNLPDYPRLIDIKIDNLWRLEAQNGKFLYQPCINFDWFYSLHRIVFKVSNNDIKLLDNYYIYPDSKSPLEERIDGFLLSEETRANVMNFNNFIEELKKSGVNYIFEDFSGNDGIFGDTPYVKSYVNEEVLLSFNWQQDEIKGWENKKTETFKEIFTPFNLIFNINSFSENIKNKKIITLKLQDLFKYDENIRNKSIRFSINSNINNSNLSKKFEEYSFRIWNGMRKLPYSNDDIIKVISDLMLIINLNKYEYKSFNNEYLEIILTDGTGGYNNAFVSERSLRNSMRDDLNKVLKNNINSIQELILAIKRARLLYKYNDLVKLFVESIILTQVMYMKEDFVIYSPFELDWIGIP